MSKGTFDIDAYCEALEKPSVKIDGKTYEGRILSIVEWMPYESRFKTLEQSNGEDFSALVTDFLYKVFPKPTLAWKKDIVPDLISSPALMELLKGFLELQATAVLPLSMREKTSGIVPPESH